MKCKTRDIGCKVSRKNNGTWDEERRIRNMRREILDLKYKIQSMGYRI